MKRLGCCALCDKECFEIKERFTDGDITGYPKVIGAPLEHARRVHLVFSNGTIGSVTMDDECPRDMPRLFAKIRESWAFEGTNGKREQSGGYSLTLKQQWIMGAVQLEQVKHPPLGVLFEETWMDAIAREMEHGRAAG